MNGTAGHSTVSAHLSQQTAGLTPNSNYVLPPISLFDKVKEEKTEDRIHLEHTQKTLQATLDSFGIAGRVSDIVIGPRITRFEVSLDPGVKVEKVSSITNNIAMEMQAESVRVLAPIHATSTSARSWRGKSGRRRRREPATFRSFSDAMWRERR